MTAPGLTKRKRLGAYFTPPSLARYLVRWAVRTPRDRVVEPSCEEAAFLAAVVQHIHELHDEVVDGQILGWEIDPDAARLAAQVAPGAEIRVGDFFDQDPPSVHKQALWDVVIGNPPYVRYHHFAGSARDKGIALARAAGVQMSGLASSWAPFVVHAATFLQPHGRLALVLPAELLSADYAAPVREFLLRRFSVVDVISFEARVFPGALVDAVLLLAEGVGPGRLRVHRLPDAEALTDFVPNGMGTTGARKWTVRLLENHSGEALAQAADTLVPLGSLATVDVGIVTGANDFFVFGDGEARTRGLHPADLRPVIARSVQMRGYTLAEAEWSRQRAEGLPVWLFAPAETHGAAADYIASGVNAGVSTTYKCRVRDPWWRLSLPAPPDLLLSYMSNHVPRLTVNEARVLTTNLIHHVRLGLFADGLDPRLLALSWVNSASMLSAEVVGRAYGGGVLKLETREAERVLVPRPDLLDQQELERQAPAIDHALRTGRPEDVADVVDPIVLGHLAPAVRAALRSGWHDLRARRKQRSTPARAA